MRLLVITILSTYMLSCSVLVNRSPSERTEPGAGKDGELSSDDNPNKEEFKISGYEEEIKQEIDIVFVADSSSSMTDEAQVLGSQLKEFQNTVNSRNSSEKVYLLASSSQIAQADTHDDIVKVADDELSDSNMFDRTRHFLETTDKLRSDSFVHLVFMSDDDPAGVGSVLHYSGFKSYLDGSILRERVMISALVGLTKKDNPDTPWCKISNIGSSFQKLAQVAAYQGEVHELCSSSLAEKINSLSDKKVRKFVVLSYELAKINEDKSVKTVKRNGEEIDKRLYRVEREAKKIVFEQGIELTADDTITILY